MGGEGWVRGVEVVGATGLARLCCGYVVAMLRLGCVVAMLFECWVGIGEDGKIRRMENE